MTTDPNIRPVTTNRSSLLFSPTAEDNRRQSQKSSELATASSLFEGGAKSNSLDRRSSDSISIAIATAATTATTISTPTNSSVADILNSTPSKEAVVSITTTSHSKTPSIYNTNINTTTTGHLPLSSSTINPVLNYNGKFSNISQPALKNNNWSAPIPATRFDTVTSYVDVIYQQQQQQQEQYQHRSSQPSKKNNTGIYSVSESKSNEFDSLSMEEAASNVVYLSPSDGIDGDSSFMASCSNCTMIVMTEVEPFNGGKSYRMAMLLIPLLSCWLPLSSCKYGRKWKDVKHLCPKCRSVIAIYRK